MPELKRSLAVVIGINQYDNGIPALKTAVNDAKKIAYTLETKYQYQVLRLLDEDARGVHLKELFAAFEQQTLPLPDGSKTQIQKDDRLLFYFAGHGIALDALDNADGPMGLLIPQDARMDNDSSLLPMKRLHDALLALPCRHLLVILDCCFAGAFRWAGERDAVRSQKMYRERYERFISGCAQQVITSAADDEKAADSLYRFGQRSEHEGHSPFAELLLKGLSGEADYSRDGAITATELYVYIHGELGKTNAKQTPGFSQLKRHDKGEYIFPIPGFKANKLEEAPKLDEKANPYKGLESFEEGDSDKFFGRKALIETLQEFVSNHPLTVVLGASGSGKSSLVKAGLIPQLKKQREQWRVLDPIRPGESPFRALNYALERENLPVFAIPNQPSDELTSGDASKEDNSSDNTLWYEQGLQNLSFNLVAWREFYPNSKLLLVIDQSEELVTLSRDEVEREMFLKGLARALKAFPDWLRIVLTLRSDFEPQFRETALEPYWSGARFIVPAMTREELRQAIVEPATAKVMYFEPPKLVDQLIDEVVQMPGALPLLSFTLSELYLKYIKSVREGKRNNRAITQEDYEELGGVARSLTQRADCEYEDLVKLDPAYEQTVRHVMLRMVALSGSELARRQVDLSELEYPEPKNERVKLVIERFASARLLVKGRDIEGNLYVEPAHDALVRGWQKLRTWKDRELASLLLQRELTAIANKWTTSRQDKQAVGLLWDDDPRLPLVRQVLESDDNWLNSPESEFAQHSIQRRRNNRRRLVGAVAGVILALSGLTIFAGIQWRNAEIGQIRALSRSSAAAFTLNRDSFDALIDALRAGKRLKRLPWGNRDRQLQADVMTVLSQAAFWIKEQNRLEEHSSWVNSFSFSPDGQEIASASGDGTIKLWQHDGSVIATLKGHKDGVTSVSFSPNGQFLVSGSLDGTVRLWRRDGTLLATFRGPGTVRAVDFSRDGQVFAAAGDDNTVKLWELDGKLVATLIGHSERVNSVNISRDGQIITSGSDDDTVKLWRRDGSLITTLKGHQAEVISVSFSPNSQFLASGSLDNTVKLWRRDGTLIKTLEGHNDGVRTISFSSDGKILASAGRDNTVKVWQRDGTLLTTLTGHTNSVTSVNFSPDGQILGSASSDGTIKLWQLKNPRLTVLTNHSNAINSVNFSPNGQLVAAASVDRTIKLWRRDGFLVATLSGHSNSINNVTFSLNGQLIASAGDDNKVNLWQPNNSLILSLKGQNAFIDVRFSTDGQTIATTNYDGTVKLWRQDGTLIKTLGRHDGIAYSVRFSPNGQMIASASEDGTVKLWKTDGTLITILKEPKEKTYTLYQAVFSPDSQMIAAASKDGTVKLWKIDGTLVTTLGRNDSPVTSVSFNPDGRILASANEKGTIFLWHLDRTLITELTGQSKGVWSLSFSPDGRTLASASDDGSIILWSLDNLTLNRWLTLGCSSIQDYLKTNPNVDTDDRHLCADIPSQP